MERNKIKDFIIQFVKDFMEFELSQEAKDSKKSLLDPEDGMNSRDLLLLVMQLQKEYHVVLQEEDILEKRLDYMDNLIDCMVLAYDKRGIVID